MTCVMCGKRPGDGRSLCVLCDLDVREHVRALKREHAALIGALRRYGHHERPCHGRYEDRCGCGLTTAVSHPGWLLKL